MEGRRNLPGRDRVRGHEKAQDLLLPGSESDWGPASWGRQRIAEHVTEFELCPLPTDQPATFTAALADWVYTSSIPLLLPGAMDKLAPGVDVSAGILFCVPNRYQFAFHVISDPTAAAYALMHLPHFAVGGYAQGTSPLSPHVYLWHEGRTTQLTAMPEGQISVTPGPYLEKLFSQIQ